MVALVVLTIGVVGGMASFKYITQAITASRTKTIATNMAQEKMEVLKNKSYFQLLVTTYTATSVGYSPNFTYDAGNYPPETFTLWGAIAFTRVVKVDYVSVSGASVSTLSYTSNDPGMKKISVYVYWTERNAPAKVQVDSYYANPSVAVLSTGFRGQVCRSPNTATCSTANAVAGALVQVMGTPKWRGYADSDGNYNFQVAPGSYSLVCSTPGFVTQSTDLLSVAEGLSTSRNFSIAAIASGTVDSSSLYTYDPSLVISQVVASTVQADGFDAQYVELFNPTTAAMNIGASAASHAIQLNITSTCGNVRTCQDIALTYVSTYVASGHYYLIANRSSFTVLGTNYNADAYYTDTANGTCSPAPPVSDWSAPAVKRILQAGHNGTVWLTDANSNILDAVGWDHSSSRPAPSPRETGGIPFNGSNALQSGEQIVRFSTPCAVGNAYGRAYDTDDNPNNFYYNNSGPSLPIGYPPFTSTGAVQTILAGRPSTGAYVFADDGNSSGIVSSSGSVSGPQGQTCLFSSFTLVGVATGTWTVTAVSNSFNQIVSNVVVTQGASIGIANSATSPAWPATNLNYIAIASTYTGGLAVGYVYGAGASYNTRLSGISVGAGGSPTTTDAQGLYILSLSTGTNTVIANYNSANGNYQTSSTDVTITQGTVTTVADFHLAQGGFIRGYVTSGTGALPNVVVDATQGGAVYADTSDNTGYFSIFVATASAAYTLTPELDSSQSYTSSAVSPCAGSPISCTVTAAGSTVFAGTVTVSGSMGTITGTVTSNGSAITTGVLIIASTATVPDPPADVVASSAPALAAFYAVSSQGDGTYSLDVRGSTSTPYNMRAFYPVVDINTGSVSYTSKTHSDASPSGQATVSAGASVTRNFTWP